MKAKCRSSFFLEAKPGQEMPAGTMGARPVRWLTEYRGMSRFTLRLSDNLEPVAEIDGITCHFIVYSKWRKDKDGNRAKRDKYGRAGTPEGAAAAVESALSILPGGEE